METAEVLSSIRSLDVKLWSDGDRLRFSAPDGVMTQALRAELAQHKTEILAFLRRAEAAVNQAAHAILPVSRDGEAPLSFAQQRLWFLDQLSPGNSLYNISQAIQVKGALDSAALERTLNEIVRRHEILRTTFASIDGKPVQVITPDLRLALPVVDLGNLEEAEREIEARRLAAVEAAQPFDLSRGPLLRATLLRLEPERHVVLFTMSHIVSDGWSIGVLVREVGMLYDAFANGRPSPLPELPIQYADFAQWQRRWLRGEEMERRLAYWKKQLANSPPMLALPTDRPRPAVQTFRGRVQSISLTSELSAAIRELSRQTDCTLFMTLLAAFKTLLLRYTGQEDILVGTVVANRNRAEIEPLIGFFVNTLALRGDLSGDPSFRELLGRVREMTLGAYAHQDLPFEKLVGEIQPDRDLSHAPLFQVAFQLRSARHQEAFEAPGLALSLLEVESKTAKFDLALSMVEGKDRLSGTLEYNTDLYDDATITRLLGHFRTLLESVAADPDRRLSSLPIIGDAERRQLLIEWNGAEADYPKDRCVHELFEDQVEQRPDAIAVCFEDQQLSYRELNRRANQLAHYLRKMGVGPESLVGVCVERSVEMIVAALGALKAGAAYVPMDPAYPEDRLRFMIEDSQAAVLLTRSSIRNPQSAIRNPLVVCLDADWPAISKESETTPKSGVTSDNLAYVIYTSGSTGKPKGAMLRHSGLCNFALAHFSGMNVTPQSRILQFASFSFDASVAETFITLLSGGALCLASRDTLLSAPDLIRLLQEQAITMAFLPPSMLRLAPADQTPALRTIVSAGEACAREIVDRWSPGRDFFNAYGPTEVTIGPTFGLVNAMPAELRNIPIGAPIANTQIYLLDQHQELAPIGALGEIYVGGVGLARGYLNRPDLTAERFIPNPFSEEPGERLYKTGDLARYLPDGNVEFLGRCDHQVKVRGFRIELGEIEAALGHHPAIREAVVEARDDASGNKRLVAYLALNDVTGQEAAMDVGALRGFLRESLPEHMVPSSYVFLAALPLTPNGKVDRRALPEPDQTRPELANQYVAPRTSEEKIMADIWARIIGVERVGVYDNFFELGGDSMKSIQVVARANQAGLHFTPAQLFKQPTIASLVQSASESEIARAEQGVVTGSLPLTPIQRFFFERQTIDPHHWNWAFLRETPQSLNPALLEQTIRHLLIHHDALRLRFNYSESGWRQFNAGPDESAPFVFIDLSRLGSEEQIAALEAAAADLQGSLNLSKGPLLRVAYFSMGGRLADRALLIFHHLVVDMVSSHILMEDFQTIYQRLSRGEDVDLPPKTTSFREWSLRLARHAQSSELKQELDYWVESLSGEVPALPLDYPAGVNSEASTETVLTAFSVEETRALMQEMPAVTGARMQEFLLTALIKSWARWTGQSRLLVDVEGHGREDILRGVDLSRTVGWFTSMYPMMFDLGGAVEPSEALRLIQSQLRRVPNRGIGYGLLRYLCDDEEVRRRISALPQAEVNFNYLGQLDQQSGRREGATPFRQARESKGPERSLRSERLYRLYVVGSVRGERLRMHWNYSANLHSRITIERLAASFDEELRRLIAHCLSTKVS
ncbi:MAG: Linear gramicidin synthase subunit D [Acidobacteria bacterium]|nr:Linear gramicidin synthase subunit D [Acidobacteriota bacterium]